MKRSRLLFFGLGILAALATAEDPGATASTAASPPASTAPAADETRGAEEPASVLVAPRSYAPCDSNPGHARVGSRRLRGCGAAAADPPAAGSVTEREGPPHDASGCR